MRLPEGGADLEAAQGGPQPDSPNLGKGRARGPTPPAHQELRARGAPGRPSQMMAA